MNVYLTRFFRLLTLLTIETNIAINSFVSFIKGWSLEGST